MKCSGLLQGDWLDWILSLKLLANDCGKRNEVNHFMLVKIWEIGVSVRACLLTCLV